MSVGKVRRGETSEADFLQANADDEEEREEKEKEAVVIAPVQGP